MSRSLVARLVSFVALGALCAGCHTTRPAPAEKGLSHLELHGQSAATERAADDELAAVRAKLRESRLHHLEVLHAYWQAGSFPENHVKPIVANIFRDEQGHLCAVANMVDKDGLHELVNRTARQDNLVRVASLDGGELHDWVLTSGFTREEIAMIQVPYMPMPDRGAVKRPSAPSPVAAQDDIARARTAERKRLQAHLAEVERRLRDDSDQSLEIAAQRIATRGARQAS